MSIIIWFNNCITCINMLIKILISFLLRLHINNLIKSKRKEQGTKNNTYIIFSANTSNQHTIFNTHFKVKQVISSAPKSLTICCKIWISLTASQRGFHYGFPSTTRPHIDREKKPNLWSFSFLCIGTRTWASRTTDVSISNLGQRLGKALPKSEYRLYSIFGIEIISEESTSICLGDVCSIYIYFFHTCNYVSFHDEKNISMIIKSKTTKIFFIYKKM